MTRRWSRVPCSRSRITAAPARMMASMVTLLIIPMTVVNHAVVMLRLNAMRTSRLTGDSGTPLVPTGLDQLWVADITYVRLLEEFAFLAVLLDAFSRIVIGWALEKHLRV